MKVHYFPGLGSAPGDLTTFDVDIKATDPEEIATLANLKTAQQSDDSSPGRVVAWWLTTAKDVAFVVATPDEHQGQFACFLGLTGDHEVTRLKAVVADIVAAFTAWSDADHNQHPSTVDSGVATYIGLAKTALSKHVP